MRVIIAGSRTITDAAVVALAMARAAERGIVPTEVVTGCAPGVDRLGEAWADERGIPVKRFPADWTAHGKRAGALRNVRMADHADALVAIWDGESRGTLHMIEAARARGLDVYVWLTSGIG